MIREKQLTFDILVDPENDVAYKYGIVFRMSQELIDLYTRFGIDLPKYNGDNSWTLPMPACLILDSEGVVQYTAINPDYTVRPEPEETLEALKKMVSV